MAHPVEVETTTFPRLHPPNCERCEADMKLYGDAYFDAETGVHFDPRTMIHKWRLPTLPRICEDEEAIAIINSRVRRS